MLERAIGRHPGCCGNWALRLLLGLRGDCSSQVRIDKEVWQRVAPHTPNGSFNEFDFESKLAQILDGAELPGGRSPLTDPIEVQNGYEV